MFHYVSYCYIFGVLFLEYPVFVFFLQFSVHWLFKKLEAENLNR